MHANFANRLLGGGVLRRGCVQEEIRFCLNPDLFIARLLSEVLGRNDAVLIYGTQRYSAYEGYSQTFKWAGDYRDVGILYVTPKFL